MLTSLLMIASLIIGVSLVVYGAVLRRRETQVQDDNAPVIWLRHALYGHSIEDNIHVAGAVAPFVDIEMKQ